MRKIVLYIVISAMLFSTMEVALKIAGSDFDAFQLTFLRFAIGGFFLLPFALVQIKRKDIRIKKSDFFSMLVLGIICIPIAMVLFQLGVENLNASTAAVIFCINPMFTMFFAHFITEEKLTLNKILSVFICILGITFMAAPWNVQVGDSLLGVSYSLLAATFFGLYTAMGKRKIYKLGGLPLTSISFLLGTIAMIPLMAVLDKPIISGIRPDNFFILFYIGIMITGVGYLCYFMAMEHGNASIASIVFFIKPGLAPIFAVFVLSETININGFLGIALVFIGSYINLKEQLSKNLHKKVKVKS